MWLNLNSYDAKNLVDVLNYNDEAGGSAAERKQAVFAYNKDGQLVEMDDWTGTNSFTLDQLGRIVSVTDNNDQTTGYAYDAVGKHD